MSRALIDSNVLITRPLALRAIRPEQPNRAAELVANRVSDFKVFS